MPNGLKGEGKSPEQGGHMPLVSPPSLTSMSVIETPIQYIPSARYICLGCISNELFTAIEKYWSHIGFINILKAEWVECASRSSNAKNAFLAFDSLFSRKFAKSSTSFFGTAQAIHRSSMSVQPYEWLLQSL